MVENNVMVDIEKVLKICDEFLEIPSSIGYEKPFLDYLNKRALDLGYNTILKEDYLVIKPKNLKVKSKYLFSAHVDRHSVIRNNENNIEHLGFYLKKKFGLKFKRERQEKFEIEIVNKLNEVFGDENIILDERFLKFNNVVGKNIKFEREEGDLFYNSFADRFTNLDILSYDENCGMILNEYKILRSNVNVSKRLVEFDLDKDLKEEDKIFMLKSQIQRKNDLFFGQIDNVISVAVLFYILENFDFNEEIIFTTKEEIGQSWKCILDYNSNLKVISLDTSPFSSFEGKNEGFLVLRKGDENGIFDLNLVKKIEMICNDLKISTYFKPSDFGQTELGNTITNSKGKINGTTLQLPTMNYHTIYETSTLKSLENYIKVILELL